MTDSSFVRPAMYILQCSAAYLDRRIHVHEPVMKNEVIAEIAPIDNGLYIDCTFGAGGHTRAILDAANCFVHSIDRDKIAQEIWEGSLKNQYADRTSFALDTFSNALNNCDPADGILMDLGVSSMQLDNPERGFSFMHDGPLSMSMGHGAKEAYDFVNTATEEEIATVLFYYGDESKSRQIARSIAHKRATKPIETTSELASIVRMSAKKWTKIDPATKTFMALRMRVNDELNELLYGMMAAMRALKHGGKLLIISFNSSEDRIIKSVIRDIGGMNRYGNEFLWPGVGSFHFANSKIKPSAQEVERNPRARSAGMRVIRRVG